MALGRSPAHAPKKIPQRIEERPIRQIGMPLLCSMDKLEIRESMAGLSIGDFFSRQIKFNQKSILIKDDFMRWLISEQKDGFGLISYKIVFRFNLENRRFGGCPFCGYQYDLE